MTPALSSKYKKIPSFLRMDLRCRMMTQGMIFLRSSGLPFLTVPTNMSPRPAAGSLFRRPLMPGGETQRHQKGTACQTVCCSTVCCSTALLRTHASAACMRAVATRQRLSGRERGEHCCRKGRRRVRARDPVVATANYRSLPTGCVTRSCHNVHLTHTTRGYTVAWMCI